MVSKNVKNVKQACSFIRQIRVFKKLRKDRMNDIMGSHIGMLKALER